PPADRSGAALLGTGCSRRGFERSAQMLGQMLVHLEHRATILAENLLQFVVGDDLALVLGILEIVLADMVPDLADDLAARQRIGTGDRGKISRGLHRTLQTALSTLCHTSLPFELMLEDRERNSPRF